MKIRDTRLWAVFIAIAFLLLWCASIGVTCAVPAQEPLAEPIQAAPVPEIRLIGVLGWGLVGLGFLGVVLAVALSSRPKRRRKAVRTVSTPKQPYRVTRSVYTPVSPRRYHRNIEVRR